MHSDHLVAARIYLRGSTVGMRLFLGLSFCLWSQLQSREPENWVLKKEGKKRKKDNRLVGVQMRLCWGTVSSQCVCLHEQTLPKFLWQIPLSSCTAYFCEIPFISELPKLFRKKRFLDQIQLVVKVLQLLQINNSHNSQFHGWWLWLVIN